MQVECGTDTIEAIHCEKKGAKLHWEKCNSHTQYTGNERCCTISEQRGSTYMLVHVERCIKCNVSTDVKFKPYRVTCWLTIVSVEHHIERSHMKWHQIQTFLVNMLASSMLQHIGQCTFYDDSNINSGLEIIHKYIFYSHQMHLPMVDTDAS